MELLPADSTVTTSGTLLVQHADISLDVTPRIVPVGLLAALSALIAASHLWLLRLPAASTSLLGATKKVL